MPLGHPFLLFTRLGGDAVCVGPGRGCVSAPPAAPRRERSPRGTRAHAAAPTRLRLSVAVRTELLEDRAGGQLRGLHGAGVQVRRGLRGGEGAWVHPRAARDPRGPGRATLPPRASLPPAGTATPVSWCVSGCTSCCGPCGRWTWAWSGSFCSRGCERGCKATASPWPPTAPSCLPHSQASRPWRPQTSAGACGGRAALTFGRWVTTPPHKQNVHTGRHPPWYRPEASATRPWPECNYLRLHGPLHSAAVARRQPRALQK